MCWSVFSANHSQADESTAGAGRDSVGMCYARGRGMQGDHWFIAFPAQSRGVNINHRRPCSASPRLTISISIKYLVEGLGTGEEWKHCRKSCPRGVRRRDFQHYASLLLALLSAPRRRPGVSSDTLGSFRKRQDVSILCDLRRCCHGEV